MSHPVTPVEYALAYAAKGLSVFPLHWAEPSSTGSGSFSCSCGNPECRAKAKHPLTPNGSKESTADAGQIMLWWRKHPQAGIGLTLPEHVVIDIDPRNGGDVTLAALEAKHGQLPDTWHALTGGGGDHYVYKATEGVTYPGTLGKGIDLKRGVNSYIVVEPTLHVSGISYAWEASSDPLDGAELVTAPDWLATALAVKAAADPAGKTAVGLIPIQQAIELRSALNFLDFEDREVWLAVGMALHSTSAANAFGLWAEWSQLSPKYNQADQRRVWNSFTHKPGGRHVESIFAMATARNWPNPASKQAAQYNDRAQAAIDAVNRREHVKVQEPAPVPATEPFPVAALNDMAAWIDNRYAITHPDVTRQTVLAVAGLITSRVYVGEGGSPCHLCLGLVADSNILTAYAKDAVSRILDDAGLRRMMRATRVGAPSNVYSTLLRSPAAIHVASDYGHQANFAKRQPSGSLDQAFATMADAYTSSAVYIDSAMDAGLKISAGDDQLVIHSPAFTMLLISTKDQAGSLLQRGEMARGLLAHQMPVLVDTAGAVERIPTTEALPAAIRDRIRAVRRLANTPGDLSQQELFGGMPGLRPNLVRVRYAINFAEHAAAISAVSPDPDHRPLILAAQSTARRLVNTLAAWNDPAQPIASRQIMDWCTSYVIKHLRLWLEQFSTLGNDDGKTDTGQKVVAAITERKTTGVQRSKLQNYCWAFRMIRDPDKRAKLIDNLIDDGDLIEFTPEGCTKKMLVSSKFAKIIQKITEGAK